ncbi:cytochrome P450 (plasmid) [Pseudonocardia sp. EC080610-09]|uniref:cytochrome P450 n=1 Tax=unclassified Pseudonocardia TaxID=2619320 RepID=UPI000706267B|nr:MULTISPECIES: cytochrome P450 [unclassified Pseudonocardia]ALL79663.1 cytochrome P450 [Pseudonocardia sp. EC080610-09]ALL85380.1 cytochrome P450 [Pseudonocardia sp. EC080619-01]
MSKAEPWGFDLSDITGFWSEPLETRSAAFAELRGRAELPFFEAPTRPIPDPGAGYYALTRYDDIVDASRAPGIFTSGLGATTLADLSPQLRTFLDSMIHTDDPRHARLRRIVSRGFTRKRLAGLQDSIQRAASSAVDSLLRSRECDAVETIASRFPLTIICDMMGIPQELHEFVHQRTNVLAGSADPGYTERHGSGFAALLAAARELTGLMHGLAEQRRVEPTDDVTSALMHAEIEGERLSPDELASFFILLLAAGSETTRNAISWGFYLLTRHPDQRTVWLADPDAVTAAAVEEIIRWSSPIIFMRRTLSTAATIGGSVVPARAKVAMFYWSANRDPSHFDRPDEFDVRRLRNRHIGFGGPGPHYCLGAHLARNELATLFTELLKRAPRFATTSEPYRLRSMFINGIVRLPIVADTGDTGAPASR